MKKLRILVFEDDSSLANLVKFSLVQKGHEVQIFSDPTLCPVYLNHAMQCPSPTACADVIITDQMMPNMTGLEFLKFQRMRGCKALDENKAIITASVMNAEMKESINQLGCHYIRKPFHVATVIKWVDECAMRLQKSASPTFPKVRSDYP